MPTVASYCTTFLKPEMRHIYRQITGLRRYDTFVICKERQCAEMYPMPEGGIETRARCAEQFHPPLLAEIHPARTAHRLSRRIRRARAIAGAAPRGPDARLFRTHRRASAAVHPALAEAGGGLVSRHGHPDPRARFQPTNRSCANCSRRPRSCWRGRSRCSIVCGNLAARTTSCA